MFKFLNNNKIGLCTYLLGIFLLFVGFYFNIDGYGTALSGDFRDTWPYVLKLKENFFFNPSEWTLHLPLHYYFLSKLDLLLNNQTYVRFIFCLISISVPYFFYLCLKFQNSNHNFENLIIISSIIFFTPSFIYSAVWANNNNTSYIFLLVGTYFFFKSESVRKNSGQENINTYFALFFLALTCYTRQYYSIFYSFFLIYYLKELNFKRFLILGFFSLLLALPGILFLYSYPDIFNKLKFSGNISNTFLGNITTLFVYTLPVFLIHFFYSKEKLFNFKKIALYFVLSLLISFLIFLTYNINTMGMNGGAIFILSNKIFGNYYLFYFIFFINLILIFILFNNPLDLFFIFSIIFVVSGIIVLQKYLEPLFLIFFFLYSKSIFKNLFFTSKNAALLLVLYHLLYLFVATSNVLHLISFI